MRTPSPLESPVPPARRIAVAGGRNRSLREPTTIGDDHSPSFAALLADELAHHQAAVLVTGGATGIDRDAENLGKRLGLTVAVFHANWTAYGRAAGPIRNAAIADYADLLVAFPGGKGTADLIRKFEELGKTVVRVTQRGKM